MPLWICSLDISLVEMADTQVMVNIDVLGPWAKHIHYVCICPLESKNETGAWINVEHSVVALRSKLHGKFH